MSFNYSMRYECSSSHGQFPIKNYKNLLLSYYDIYQSLKRLYIHVIQKEDKIIFVDLIIDAFNHFYNDYMLRKMKYLL